MFEPKFGSSKSALSSVGSASLTHYDSRNRPVLTGLDIDGDGDLKPASLDRITESQSSRIQIDNDWFELNEVWTYPSPDDSTRALTSKNATRLTGFSREHPNLGLLTSETIIYDPQSATA